MFAKRYVSGISKTLLRGTSFAQLETNNIYLVNYQQTVTAWELPTVQWEGVTEQCVSNTVFKREASSAPAQV